MEAEELKAFKSIEILLNETGKVYPEKKIWTLFFFEILFYTKL